MGPRIVAVLLVGLALLGLAGCDRLFLKPLVADFAASPTFGKAPLTVQFEDRSSFDPARPIIGWEWAFGDGATSTEMSPVHTYASPGLYAVSLTVSDRAGRTATLTKPDYILVTEDEPPPPPALELPPVLGSPQAKVTILEFSDYLCPYCAKFAGLTLPQLEADYISTGKARLVFRNFPVHGDPAVETALAALCAHEQGQFWEYHDRLFAISLSEGGKALTAARLEALARELGLDSDQFKLCLASRRYAQAVKADIAEAKRLGVEGTPTFFINGQKILGAQPYETFKRVIEEELAK